VGIEGFVTFSNFKTWYRVEGDLARATDRLPLVVVHGGPGLPHNYLEPLAELADGGRPVVFYDQLGCGNSDRPDDDSLWTMTTFEEELDAVLSQLSFDRFHLFGHSWGGWLVLQYVLDRQPRGLASLVLASTCASIPAFAATTRRLKEGLPVEIQAVLDRHESAGTTDDPAYFEASMAYITQWLIRGDIPDYVFAAKAAENERVSAIMQGPEWNVTGRLKDWDVTARLAEISTPTLVTSGRYDEMTPELVQSMVDGLPDVTWALFEASAHMAHIEEQVTYIQTIRNHLASHDH
jgi:proline-specific peptidase